MLDCIDEIIVLTGIPVSTVISLLGDMLEQLEIEPEDEEAYEQQCVEDILDNIDNSSEHCQVRIHF